MFTTPREVERFVELVDGRATTVLLLENRTAAERVEEIVRVAGIEDAGPGDVTFLAARRAHGVHARQDPSQDVRRWNRQHPATAQGVGDEPA